MKMKKIRNCFWMFVLMAPGYLMAAPGEILVSGDVLGAQDYSQAPLITPRGIGLSGSADYRLSDFFALGLTTGLTEFIAPVNEEDMKTIWLDVDGRFYPFQPSPVGEAYLQLGFGVSPHLGLFLDYWPYLINQSTDPPGTVYWDTQIVAGYVFSLGKDWGLDTGLEYDYFSAPGNINLQTIGLRTGLVFSFSLDGPKKEP
jgi:hypothetical protein